MLRLQRRGESGCRNETRQTRQVFRWKKASLITCRALSAERLLSSDNTTHSQSHVSEARAARWFLCKNFAMKILHLFIFFVPLKYLVLIPSQIQNKMFHTHTHTGERKMAKNKDKRPQTRPATNNPPEEEVEGAFGLSEILKEIREFREINLTKVLSPNLRKQRQLEAKCEDLKSRAPRNNLRIYSVPEKCEGNNMIEFVKTLTRDKPEVEGEVHIERAHRAPGPKAERSDRPTSVIICFQNFTVRQKVLQAARAEKHTQVNNSRTYLDEDFTSQVFMEREKYRPVRNQQWRVLFPARLKIFEKDGKSEASEPAGRSRRSA